ncbi:MAG: ABC transporter permease [Ruminococcaceae bacterium]|nr:ABC transporter permease [Oscillospiraceae bacterium]
MKKNEPLIHITKRTDVSTKTGILVRAIAIILALIVCGIITKLFTGINPIAVYKTIITGAFGKGQVLVTIHEVAILLCVSLAVTPAFRMRFWNIGAEGQVLMGALSTAMCMFYLGGKVPDALLIVIMTVCAVAAACIWAVIPAFFKAHWGTNETLFTLMMNYVAIQLIEYFLKIADKSGSNTVGPNLLSHGWFPKVFGADYILNIIIVAVITIVLYVYLKQSKHGYELLVVGESENTARYIGINVKKVIVRTMALSGAICGVAGLLIVGGSSHSIDSNIAGGRGFTAIMVSWLAKFNPLYMVLTSLLLVALDIGATELVKDPKISLSTDFSEILTGIILFFIIGCEFFINYKVHFRNSKKAVKEDK